MAPGAAFAGTAAHRPRGVISIGGKSPLTGGIKEANAGGNPGQDLMKLGFRVHRRDGSASGSREPATRSTSTADGLELKEVPADEHRGKWNYALIEQLAEALPADALRSSRSVPQASCASRARRWRVPTRSQGPPPRAARRDEVASEPLMGSKGLKYVAVDAQKPCSRASGPPTSQGASTKLCKKPDEGVLRRGSRAGAASPSTAPAPSVGDGEQALYTFPYKNRIEGRVTRRRRRSTGMRIVESFETAWWRHAQLHDRLRRAGAPTSCTTPTATTRRLLSNSRR